jgi:hypothetical protein
MLGTILVLGLLGLRAPEARGGGLLAALLRIRIWFAPTIVILLLNRAVLDLVVCVIAIKAKVIGSLVSSNFLL